MNTLIIVAMFGSIFLLTLASFGYSIGAILFAADKPYTIPLDMVVHVSRYACFDGSLDIIGRYTFADLVNVYCESVGVNSCSDIECLTFYRSHGICLTFDLKR